MTEVDEKYNISGWVNNFIQDVKNFQDDTTREIEKIEKKKETEEFEKAQLAQEKLAEKEAHEKEKEEKESGGFFDMLRNLSHPGAVAKKEQMEETKETDEMKGPDEKVEAEKHQEPSRFRAFVENIETSIENLETSLLLKASDPDSRTGRVVSYFQNFSGSSPRKEKDEVPAEVSAGKNK